MGILADHGAAIQSKAFDVWRRLYTRFSLEPGPSVTGGLPEVGTSIVPTTNVDDLLRTPRNIVSANTDLSGGGSLTITMLTVPAGERWHLKHLFRTATVGAARVRLVDPDGVEVNLTPPLTPETTYIPGSGMVLDEGWTLAMSETGNGADTAEFIHVHVEVEQSF